MDKIKKVKLDDILYGENTVSLLQDRVSFFKDKMKKKSKFSKKDIKKIKESDLLDNLPLRYVHYFEDVISSVVKSSERVECFVK